MCTSTSAATSLSPLTNYPSLSQLRHGKLGINFPITFLTHGSFRNPTVRLSAMVADKNFDKASWLLPDDNSNDHFGGWALSEPSIPKKRKGFSKSLVVGTGTSIALLAAAIAHFSLSKSGFRLLRGTSFPGVSVPFATEERQTKTRDSDTPNEEDTVSEAIEVESSDVVTESVTLDKHQPRVITVAPDSIQREALYLLKKLKIIDEDVKDDELCTRREYARWLVRASSLLERNPKHKITPAVSLSGSISSAYEDVTVGDQDFESIQALAEAGVLLSKLSSMYSLDGGVVNFSPDRFISRLDLIDWRAQLEYDFVMAGNRKMLKTKLDLMDVRETSSYKWPGVLMDMLAGDKSLLRRVFGKIRRLQPNKPSTKAQAAVALTSGRMAEAVHSELSRLETEESSKQAAKAEIKHDLLDRGEVQKYWAEKMEEEKARGLKVQQLYIDALKELEEERVIQVGVLNGYLKEKAAMDCQKQLLNGLKEEVDEMSEKLISERAEQIAEEEIAQTLRRDLQAKMEGILDAKSLLEAEIEALRILRSWIEDEARKSRARSKVLEEVGQRWKWDRR